MAIIQNCLLCHHVYIFIYDMFNAFLLQLVKQPNFLPDSATTGPGFELERLSILGPFFALSVFAEDNVSLFQIIIGFLL